jgi:glucosamine--fructose-6-phosphate aminotransferase (isomerizing)
MCGIVGYIGDKQAQAILLKSLSKLQYRGYDSCGIAVKGAGITVFKAVGTVDMLARSAGELSGTTGIGHTRWATHGAVTEANAHPHLDCSGHIAVVHNGVISNYSQLREALTGEGHLFHSETDTEVIAHLLEKYYIGDLMEAMSECIRQLEGSFAIVAMHAESPELVAARRECPLIIGKNDEKASFIGSDVLAFLEHTDRAVYLEDGDVAAISACEARIYHNGKKVKRPEKRVEWLVEDSQKAGYEHFMIKEIHEQPHVIEQSIAGRIRAIEPGISLGIERPANVSNMIFTACGSSFHASLVGEQLMTRLAGIPSRAIVASEFETASAAIPGTLLIGISQSGETADTLKAVKQGREAGMRILAITNVPGSSVTRYAHATLYTKAGPEIAVAATKTFVAQLTALYLLALAYAPVDHETLSHLKNSLKSLSGKVESLLQTTGDAIEEQARYLANYHDVFLIARGWNYPIALEGALKLKEVSYLHAEAFPAGELKHGPFALLTASTPVIAVVGADENRGAMLTSVKEVKARGAPVIALAADDDDEIEQLVDAVIRVPQTNPMFSPLLNATALQLLSYYVAKQRNCPIDLPVNLAKSVTVP